MHAVINGNRIDEHVLACVFVSDTDVSVHGEVVMEEKDGFREIIEKMRIGDTVDVDCEDAKGLKAEGRDKQHRGRERNVRRQGVLRLLPLDAETLARSKTNLYPMIA